MTVTAQAGVFAFAEQTDKGAYYSGSGSPADNSMFYRHKAMDVDVGPQQDQRTFPLEVGGIITPTGAYKAGAFGAGGATLNPRLEKSFGAIIKGAFGTVATPALGPIYEDNTISKLATLANGKGMIKLPTGIAPSAFTLGTVTVPSNAKRLVLKVVFDHCYFSTASPSLGVVVSDGAGHTETFNLATALLSEDVDTKTNSGIVFLYGSTDTLVTGTTWTIQTPDVFSDTLYTPYSCWIGVGFRYDDAADVRGHEFSLSMENSLLSPWYQIRVVVPHPILGQELGFEILDAKLSSLRINFPQNGLVTARPDFVGREPRVIEGPYLPANGYWNSACPGKAWQTAEDYESVPVSCVLEGGITIPGGNLFNSSTDPVEMSFTNLAVTYGNNTTTPQQEMIIGQYFPEDFVMLSRAMTLQGTIKWRDSYLYEKLFKLYANKGFTWSPVVFAAPCLAKAVSPNNISLALASQFKAYMYAKRIIWAIDRPPVLAGGEIVTVQITGTAIDNGGKYSKLLLINGKLTAY
jgi:hypothetical protein